MSASISWQLVYKYSATFLYLYNVSQLQPVACSLQAPESTRSLSNLGTFSCWLSLWFLANTELKKMEQAYNFQFFQISLKYHWTKFSGLSFWKCHSQPGVMLVLVLPWMRCLCLLKKCLKHKFECHKSPSSHCLVPTIYHVCVCGPGSLNIFNAQFPHLLINSSNYLVGWVRLRRWKHLGLDHI